MVAGRDVIVIVYDCASGEPVGILEYDGLLRLVRRVDNGASETRYQRTAGGKVHKLLRTGFGPTHFTWSAQGELLWQVDAAGTQSLSTWRPSPHEAGSAVIRRVAGPGRRTTAQVALLNAEGEALGVRELAGGLTRETTLDRDARGRLEVVIAADGMRTRYVRNLLGWVGKLEETTPAGLDTTEYGHNLRGQVTSVTDPAGQPTGFEYNAFGEVKLRQTPGTPAVSVGFTYDALGRVKERRSSESVVVLERDGRGDVRKEWLGAIGGPQLAARDFDTLGRLKSSTYFNPSLTSVPPEERRVTRTVEYDALSRVKLDAVRVGSAPRRDVTSAWTVNTGTSAWQRQLGYPDGAFAPGWVEGFDEVGRLATKQRPGGAGLTTFHWEGELYTGRTQRHGPPSPLPERVSPLREVVRLDAFGLPIGFSYRALDLGSAGQPLDSDYCGTPYDAAACGGPVVDVSLLRDVMGRVVSKKELPSHPVFDGSGGRQAFTHPRPWEGFAYDVSSKLSKKWRHEGLSGEVDPGGLSTHAVTAGDIQALASSAWLRKYNREVKVGATLSIEEGPTGAQVFSATRSGGHQLQSTTIDGAAASEGHDGEGRLVTFGAARNIFDARGQLAEVHSGTGLVEAYAYDDSGRLAAGHASNAAREATLSWDGAQAVIAYQASGAPAWEATWGPGLDKLLEWRDGPNQRVHLPLLDERNSVVATLDAADGRVTAKADFTPEGRLIRKDAAGAVLCSEEGSGTVCPRLAGMPFGFTGAFTSQRTGLIYLRNRWYSPRLGQFLSHDALGFVDSFNLYAYAAWDPVNNADPLGLFASPELIALRNLGLAAPAVRFLLKELPKDAAGASRLGGRFLLAPLLMLGTKHGPSGEEIMQMGPPAGGPDDPKSPAAPPAPPVPAEPAKSPEQPPAPAAGGSGEVPPGAPQAAAAGGEEEPRRIWEGSPKHGLEQRADAAPEPANPQEMLDSSVPFKGTTPRRVGVDPKTGEFGVFDRTRQLSPSEELWHGHVRNWEGLSQQMRNALVKAGKATRKGKPITPEPTNPGTPTQPSRGGSPKPTVKGGLFDPGNGGSGGKDCKGSLARCG